MNKRINKSCVVLVFMFFVCTIYSQNWSKSFTAGNNDINGNFLGGSEVLQLIDHKKKLYASIGYWQDQNNIWYGGTNNNIGWGQIISLDSPNGQWKEDLNLGSSYLRPEVLKQIIFTKNTSGNLLSSPDTLLLTAGYSINYLTSTVTVKSFVKDDINNVWKESQIVQGGFPAGENYSIRDVEVFTDQLTGLERVYASVGTKGIFVGTYNPSSPGKIDWVSNPEIGPIGIRSLGIATANNTMYFSSGNKLYRRNDGSIVSYSVAHDFSDLNTTINSAVGGVRGLTTIQNSNANNEALLLMWCPNGQSNGVIYRLEADGQGGFNRFYETKISLMVESYLPGSSVNYLLGAYNEFYEYIDPITNDTIHLIGFEADISGGGFPTWNGYYKGALFAKRETNIQYTIEEINGPISTNDAALVANRCYVKSPFDNEQGVIYYGGFDPNSNASTNMAWVYKKDFLANGVSELNQDKINFTIYPNPANNVLNINLETDYRVKCELISIIGKTVFTCMVDLGANSIDISALSPNVYFVKIENNLIKFIKT
jgi:hypothetical protein